MADDFFNAPDWRPDLHPAMPKIVQYGNKDTQLRACGSCHLPTGNGHDESAYLAGLPVTYFMRQWPTGRAATASTALDPGCRDRHRTEELRKFDHVSVKKIVRRHRSLEFAFNYAHASGA